MKILYAIQGTGNGHLARATEIIPILQEYGQVDILVSGIQGDIKLSFKVKYKLYGFSFIFGKKGGVDIWRTITKMRLIRFVKDVTRIPVNEYDIILNDFEPVTAWACKFRNKKCIGISHQNSVLHSKAVKPRKSDFVGELVLKYYAPSAIKYGFHFKELDDRNYTPVIRSAIREARPKDNGHFVVYLPAFNDKEIKKILEPFGRIPWEVFSKHCTQQYNDRNIRFNPVSLERFTKLFINCRGVLCTAGFETPAEALYMGKKLCVVPMKNQYEQACNAAMLAEMGVMVVNKKEDLCKRITTWLEDENVQQILYPNKTRHIIHSLLISNK